jgi:dTDP-glucose 4,6-dehydratase
MRVLIAGGAGFLGSHLTDRFLADGCDVVVLDNFVTGARANIAHLLANPRFRLIEQDVIDPVTVPEPLDGVLHLASPASPVDFLRLPVETLLVGSIGTLRLLDLARDHGARFLLASTSEVYGDPEVHPQPETYWGHVNPIGPRSVYDESKRFAEALTMAYQRTRGLDTRIARIFNTYGPRMRFDDGRVVSNFIRQALDGEPLTVYGDGSQTRSFCYVDDLVEGLIRLFHSARREPVNLGSEGEFTILELAGLVRDMLGTGSPFLRRALPFDDPRQRRPDVTVARTVLGWSPTVPLREGLHRTIEDFRARRARPEPEAVSWT